MNPDRIKKAVELADGWRLSDDQEPLIYLDDGTVDGISFMSWSYPQFMLDALVAQLTRQVDALGPIECEISSVTVRMYCPSNNEWGPLDTVGPTRTENTINAILDSGVLK